MPGRFSQHQPLCVRVCVCVCVRETLPSPWPVFLPCWEVVKPELGCCLFIFAALAQKAVKSTRLRFGEHTHTHSISGRSSTHTPTNPYRLFEAVSLLEGERVRLGDDGNDVDHVTEPPHELHIQGPQTGGGERERERERGERDRYK